jgi:chorismate mutase
MTEPDWPDSAIRTGGPASAAPAAGDTTGAAAGPAGEDPQAAGGAGDDEVLQNLRGEIERLDRAILELLAERVALARRVGEAKRVAAIPVLDPAREAAVVRRAGSLARELDLDEEATRYIYWHVIGMARRAQLAP